MEGKVIKINKKDYERISIAFKENEKPLLAGLKKLAEKNRRSVGAELKLMIEEKLNKIVPNLKESQISLISDQSFFEED